MKDLKTHLKIWNKHVFDNIFKKGKGWNLRWRSYSRRPLTKDGLRIVSIRRNK
jgi:hypothetical protein